MNEKLTNINSNDKIYYLNILKKEPKNYEAILKLGLIDVKEKEFLFAKEKFEDLINIDIYRYEGHLNLSNIYSHEGNIKKAKDILENFLFNIKENIEIINAIAIILLNLKEYKDLEIFINKYINRYESYILNYLKAYNLTRADKLLESEHYFKKTIALNKNFWQSYDFLFKQYDKQSRITDFRELLKKASSIFKNNCILSYYESLYYFRVKNYSKSQIILSDKSLSNKFLKEQSDVAKADYFHLLSRVNEKLGDFDKSYFFAIERNKITLNFKENKKYNKQLILDTISVYKNFFEKKNKSKLSNFSEGIYHSNLVFLIGFPRSGTTLLDTILRSHSKTIVLEEKPYLLDVRHQFYEKNKLINVLNIDEKEKIQMQKQYMNSFNYNSKKIIIDKYPLNLIELGFIKTIFPNSKIILAIRHPLDCIISCVLTSFKMNEGMVNFENIHTTSFFYNECFQLLFKYFYFFEINYHTVKYENIIKDFTNEITSLVKFLNLSFEENMINYQKTAKKRDKINTPSYDQVVQPLYSSSINRFKNFDKVNEIKAGIQYWVNHFEYTI